MTTFNAYVAKVPGQPLEPFQYEPKPMGDYDVEIKIAYCGICHSDLHLISGDFGHQVFPAVPGHEIVGRVTQAGKNIKKLKEGMRVGIGWQRSSCLECDLCLKGIENLCPENQAICMGNYGGFADYIRTDGRFVFPLPEALPSDATGPLLCGGITVFSPMNSFVRPTMRVGVIGIGGLGHFALQFARAFGCEVTAFSTSPDKEQEARQLGAHHFVVSKDREQMKKAKNTLDFIISTVHAQLDWSGFFHVLRANGTFCQVGVSPDIVAPTLSLMTGQKALRGSLIGGRGTIRDMLEFSARHGIKAMAEVVPLADVNQAIEKVKTNKARYRMVLKVE